MAIIAFGYVNQYVMQVLLGHFASIFVFRREAYACFHHVYKFVDSLEKPWKRLPSFVADELRAAALHLPLVITNIRAQLSNTILATDATPDCGGATSAVVTSRVAELLYRSAEVRGAHVRLDDQTADKNRLLPVSAEIDSLARSLRWKEIASYRFRVRAHINLQVAAP